MSIIQQIANNEITQLELRDEAEIAFENDDGRIHEFLDALKQNTSITSVTLHGDFLCCLRVDSRGQAIEAFTGSQIQDITIGDTLLLVNDLTKMVCNLPKLRSLKLHDTLLQGQEEDFKDFEEALMKHPILKEFDMSENCDTALKKVCDLPKLQEAKKSKPGVAKMPLSLSQINSATAKTA